MASLPSASSPAVPGTAVSPYIHATGSAKGLLLTVLGELVLPSDHQSLWTGAFIEVGGRLGFEEKALRQSLSRAAGAHWLISERVGRRTRWHLSELSREMLEEGARRIYSHPRPGHPAGEWLVVLASIPESERTSRQTLRKLLTWAGLGSPSPGVWIGAHPERMAEVEHALGVAGVAGDSQVFISRAHDTGTGSLLRLVSSAWDLEQVATSYHRFIQRWGDFTDSAEQLEEITSLAALVELVHEWRRFPWIDPALPSDLHPANWPGASAERLFRSLHRRLSEPAVRQWATLG